MSEQDIHAELNYLKRALEMQKKAREKAESLLEDKSRELYLKNQRLKQALETLEKQQTQLIAQEKLASIGQLGASLAHELNNPNAFIQNNLFTLQDYVAQLIKGMDASADLVNQLVTGNTTTELETKGRLQAIYEDAEVDYIRDDISLLINESVKGTERISSIANSLRFFANPNISTEKEVDVNECIQQALHLIAVEQSQANICLELNPIPTINGLPLLLSQAIANIITNAAEAKSKKIVISSHATSDGVLIQIQDDGYGMSQKDIEHAFDSFFTLKDKQNGLGLGIAQSIISQHHGSIELNSECDKGTCVTISLPLKTPR